MNKLDIKTWATEMGYQKWLWQKMGEKCLKYLKKHGFDTHFSDNCDALWKTGICNDPMRLCRITTILHRRPMMTDLSVVLINESLGF
jgi:hypothetical protein